MIAVATPLARYRVAAAELSARVDIRRDEAQLVAVAGDPHGLSEAEEGVARGARVVIVDRPRADPAALDRMREWEERGVAVVLLRPALRADVAGDALPSAPPSDVVVQTQTSAGEMLDAVVDAVGWARVLRGGALVVRSVARAPGAVLADLAGSGAAASVVASERLGAAGARRLRAVAVGAHRVEVVSTDAVAVVTRSTAEGDLVLPRRWESGERLALRRALAALAGEPVRDLDDWAGDLAVAAQIAGGYHGG